MSNRSPTNRKRRRGWLLACSGCLGVLVLSCCGIFAFGALIPRLRPTANDIYSGAPDLAAGQDVSNALIESGVQGASVLVIPIKGTSGQIAIITLDESRGYVSDPGGADSLQTVVQNIVRANVLGDYHIQELSIDYRDTTGQPSLSFAATMQDAESYAAGSISRQDFMGSVDFNLLHTLRYFGLDQILTGTQP